MQTSAKKKDYGMIYEQLAILALVTAAAFLLTGCATVQTRKTKPVTVTDIVRMSQEKVPADEIVNKMRESGTVYRLKASELANLKEQGVPDAVINYMQQTYLDAVRRNQTLEDWNGWTMGPDGYWYGGGPFGWPDEW
jgi:PBP1b-binding outer membrane lipoprotein LpoB